MSMDYSFDSVRRHVARLIEEALGGTVRVAPGVFIAPPRPELGDLSFPCFQVAKELKKSPADVAKELETALAKGDQTVQSVTAAGPYANITLRTGVLVERIVRDVENMGKEYGKVEDGAGKTVVFEYANPNTHKEIHIGHLRNFLLGASLVHVMENAGWKLEPVSYVNDVGANVAKCLWGLAVTKGYDVRALTEHDAEHLLESVLVPERNGRFLGKVYAEATTRLEAEPDRKEEVSFVHRQLETRVKAWDKLWRETRSWCVDELRAIFQELGVHITTQYFESELLERSMEVVSGLEKRGTAVVSEGALVVNLEDEGLGVALLRKTDGSLLYLAKDLALAERKIRDFPEVARSMILVDKRQELNFKQLFSILKRIGFTQSFEFVGYEIVTLKEGVMSSRKGNVITWEQFRDDVLKYATEETERRHPDWNEGKVLHTAWCLMMGGIKYGMLKQDGEKVIIFDVKSAMSFEGNTGPYIQYAVTRLSSILKKAGWTRKKREEFDSGETVFTEAVEKRLALKLAALPDVVRAAAIELRPSLIAQWCYEAASEANAFYRDVPVLQADERVREGRLRLIAAATDALTRGLSLLGIMVPDEM